MARRQLEIDGTQRTAIPEVEEAAEAYREVVLERMELSKKEKLKKHGLLALMNARKIDTYKYDDANGEEIVVKIAEPEPKVSVKKSGEADSDIGEGVSDGPTLTVVKTPAGTDGLLAEALANQKSTGVAEDEQGDVVPPDVSTKKAKK